MSKVLKPFISFLDRYFCEGEYTIVYNPDRGDLFVTVVVADGPIQMDIVLGCIDPTPLREAALTIGFNRSLKATPVIGK